MKSTFSRFFGSGEKVEHDSKNEVESAESVVKLLIDEIQPNRYQPRTIFDDSKIEELARTIRTHGVIQPIVVRKMEEGHYEIIAGERRYRAMKMLEWTEVPAIVREMNDKETASVALIENLQREELTSIEEAQAYLKLLELHGLTQEALAQRLGKGQSTIANKIRLLKLPEEIQMAILKREISERHARALVPVKDKELQLALLQEIIDNDYNVRQLEQRIDEILNPAEKPKKNKPTRKAISKDIRIALNTIRQSLTMVTKTGINVEAEEEEHDEFYQITVKIPKKKS
ncbi:nucleoid occlusion protein [Viridibacillus sp. FSL E2-0187]|uniref:Nucleoid occlusion protein n=1 Tax=Viridibacillus arvi TaxID=263475 RepID=A0A0M0LB61_9BACL|nr:MULTISPECIES: nucleoid occlusion protein [Viridibacillus]KOO48284.1 chromosome partitioning protein ParB [Viridibacillus arvi]QOV09834.1 nucleoid occlusion protein [Viridibacillus sp. JNUCC-6]